MTVASNPVSNRYDAFQAKAVKNIVSDFKEDPAGRYLLVIPTGGGKTYTAVKAILELFNSKIIDPEKGEMALWVAHRTELRDQAEKTFRKHFEKSGNEKLLQHVAIEMLSKLETLLKENPKFKLLVIDEAHHSAAPSYRLAFDYPNLGVLGLTATPSRHDEEELPFERESFSIGFPDLVKLGIVLRPKEIKVEGGKYENITSLKESDPEQLEVLNNSYRNDAIAKAIGAQAEDLHKILIFVGTKRHAKDLADHLVASGLNTSYPDISWITGDGNGMGLSRDSFIERIQSSSRSIVVNVDVLTEGYDDPSIDTVVMARPTSSKLVFMQAMGRCIRHDPENPSKVAKLIQVHDQLPNIRYLIENRMLYSDVSDTLEPDVVDLNVTSSDSFDREIEKIFSKYKVPTAYKEKIPKFCRDDRYSLLLFRVETAGGEFLHIPVWLTRETRQQVTNSFNLLSKRMRGYKSQSLRNPPREIDSEHAMTAARVREDQFGSQRARALIFQAMKNAMVIGEAEGFEIAGRPWITYAAIHFHEPQLPDDLVLFCEKMINKESILQRILDGDFTTGDSLIRIALPLANEIGILIDKDSEERLNNIYENLSNLRDSEAGLDHYRSTQEIIDEAYFPLPTRHLPGFVSQVRDRREFSFNLKFD